MVFEENVFDYLILGAGPAGLQLGYFLAKEGHNYMILEAGEGPGMFFRKFPRHRTLISSNKIYTGYTDPEVNLRFDWNSLLSDDEELLFRNYSQRYFASADDLVRYLADFASRLNLNINYRTKIRQVTKESQGFVLTDESGRRFCCRRLIVATGFTKPYRPTIPGIEFVEDYTTVSVDPDDFRNQKVLIIGKGNSAFETAENLIETTALVHVASPHAIKLAWHTHFVGHLRAVNNNLLDTYQLKSQNAVLDATIERIERRGEQFAVKVLYSHAQGETEELIYDRVISCTGFRFDASIFDESCRPQLTINDRFPAQTSAWESVNVRDLYFMGTLTQMRDFKRTTSGFIHGFRYNAQALSRILDARYHGRPWPSREIEATPYALLTALERRINRTSALWQQFGFLCDMIALPDSGLARYYEQMPVDYVHDSEFGRRIMLTLEFGHIDGDPFSIERHPSHEKAEESVFLHPVIRFYDGRNLISEHHVLENLYGEWKDETLHLRPLLAYLEAELGTSVMSEVEHDSVA